MNGKQKGIALSVIVIVNILLAAFCGFAYAALTEKMYMSTSWQADPSTYTPMAHSGWRGGITRYFYSAIIALLLQGVLWIFNFSVLGYLIADYKQLIRTCLSIAAMGYAVTVGVACVLIWFSLT